MSTDFYNFWHSNKSDMRYVLPTAPNVCSYITLAKMLIFNEFNNRYWFYFHKTFFHFQAKFWHFCRNTPKENVKNTYCSLASYLLLSSKPRNWCNKGNRSDGMKVRKLKKKNVWNTNKTRQLKQEVLELFSMGIHAGVQRRDRKQKRFVEIKPVGGMKRGREGEGNAGWCPPHDLFARRPFSLALQHCDLVIPSYAQNMSRIEFT